ncbi:MAG TPA: efflux RND transporter periplasmic adaptor subunit [Methylomirabilota bacterium]|nr:efflux RND transporter periplasmic adaptor subunit [Methylomirabilota bacterium]
MTLRPIRSLLLPVLALAACSGGNAESKQPPKRPPVPVAVSPVERKTVPLLVQAIGTVEAYNTVQVRAQVGGELMRVHIKEGQDVKTGDLLFTIDPRPYEAALAQAQATLAKDHGAVAQARAVLQRDTARVSQAKATLARDQAQAKNAEVSERRYADLLKRELISQEQYDLVKTTADALAATVRSDEAEVSSAEETVRADHAAVRSAEEIVKADAALVENARLQLGYTTIRSPIDGRAGSLQLNQGNVVRASGNNDSTLLTINQVLPVYVSFTVPQQQLAQIKRYMAAGPLSVDAVASGERTPERGTVTFIDNAVDQTTGTIRLKATFVNTERRLWPGQFVNVALTLAIENDALVIPAAALQTGQQGPFVFVVKPDQTVDTRRVQVARTQGAETILTGGVEAGESVVTDGQPRLVQGAKVEVRTATGRAPGGGERGGTRAGGDKPAGADGKPEGGGDKPVGADKPAGGGDRPAAGGAKKPAEAGQKPADTPAGTR